MTEHLTEKANLAFRQFSPFIRNYIYQNGWNELRRVQIEAAYEIFNSEKNLLISSETASGKTEAALFPILSMMEKEDRQMFLEDLGLEQSGLEKLIQASYSLLGLISYLTAGEPEVRAWTIKKGTKAPQAAGKIHSDFERGFIRAEIVSYTDLMDCGTYTAAKEKGLVRLEGKEYVVQDGDIILFRFNV